MVFVPDREAFLETAGLRSEARISAVEFERLRDAVMPPDLPLWLEPLWRTMRYLGWVRHCLALPQSRQPLEFSLRTAEGEMPKLISANGVGRPPD